MRANPIGWIEIYVEDMARAKNFYEGVFGGTLEKLPAPESSADIEMLAFPGGPEAGYGAAGALVKMSGIKPGNNSTLVYFSCDDCAIEESKVSSLGGKVCQSKTAIGQYGFISLVTDTEGNLIGLHSLK